MRKNAIESNSFFVFGESKMSVFRSDFSSSYFTLKPTSIPTSNVKWFEYTENKILHTESFLLHTFVHIFVLHIVLEPLSHFSKDRLLFVDKSIEKKKQVSSNQFIGSKKKVSIQQAAEICRKIYWTEQHCR